MTSPAGSIGIGVSIDASDLASQITQAVTAQLRPVLNQVQNDVSGLSNSLNRIDARGIDDVAQAGDRARRSIGDLGDETDQATRSTRQNTGAVGDNTDEQRRNSSQSDETADKASKLGAAFGGAVGKVAGFTAGLVSVGGAMALAGKAIEQQQLTNKLTAQLNLTADEAAKAGKLTGQLYADNFGGSVEEVNQAVGAVQSTIGRLGEDSDDAFKSMTASALTMADVFEVDVAESTQTANNLIRNGFAKDGVEAMDLITAAMQRVPESMRGEIFPVMDEYSTYFQSIGFSGQEAMGIIVNAAQGGQIAMDKAGDAIKEFGIRATDLGDKGAMDAIKSIGLDSTQMANDLLAGGDKAQAAFDQIVDGLLKIDDPAEQAAASVALFGTPLEDLDKAKIPGFLKGLSGGESAMADFAGSADQMKDAMANGPAAAIETVRRTIEQGLVGALGTAAKFMVDNKGAAIALAGAVTTLVGAYVAYRGVAAISATIQGVTAAMRGAELATNAAAASTRAFTVTQTLMGIQSKIATAATVAQTIATRALNAAFVSGPWGWIVLAIAAVVAALVLFFTKTEAGKAVFEKLKQWVMTAWEAIKNAVVGAWNNYIYPALQAIWSFIQEKLIPVIVDFWQNTIVPAWNAISQAVQQAWTSYIQPALQAIWSFISEKLAPAIVWFVQNIVVNYWKLIGTVIAFAWNNVIKPVFSALVDFITNVIVPALTWLWQNVIVPVFNGIAAVISAWWNNWVKPVWDALVWIIQNVLAPLFTWLWQTIIVPVFNAIGAVISFWWTNVVKPVWDALVWIIQNVIGPLFTWLWNTIIVPVMNGIGAAISFAWNNIIKPVWDAFVWVLQNVLAPLFSWLWNTIIKPAMDGIGATISFAWNNVIKPVLDFWMGGWRSIGDVLNGIWNNVIKPVWDGIGNLIRSVWENFIKPAFDAVKTGVTEVGNFFSDAVAGIGRVWDGLKSILAKPINFLIGTVYNNGIKKAWDTVAKFLPGLSPAGEIAQIPEHATGGRIKGPGGIDNVLMWGSAGEHMLTVAEVMKVGGHSMVYAMRDMIRRGIPFEWDGSGGVRPTDAGKGPGLSVNQLQRYGTMLQGNPATDPQGMFQQFVGKYRDGGEILPWMKQLERAHKWAQSRNGRPYVLGGSANGGGGTDCSGFMSGIANIIQGGDGARQWATMAFNGGGNGQQSTGPQGFVAGLANTFSIGVLNGGPAGGHTAGTLGSVPLLGLGAVNVESGGSHGNVAYGGPAVGADNGQFPTKYHLPIGDNGFFQTGGGGGGPSPEEQRSFLEKKVLSIFDEVLKPVHGAIDGVVGKPPPDWRQIPHSYLKKAPEIAIDGAKKVISGLGDKLAGAWTKAKDVGSTIAHAANPLNWFDQGGVASGTGLLAKGVIAPERVLSPRQTDLFETLVAALTKISGFSVTDFTKSGGSGGDVLTNDRKLDATGRVMSDTQSLIDRTSTSAAEQSKAQHEQSMQLLQQMGSQLADKVFVPMVQTGVSSAMQASTKDGTMNALGTSIGQIAGQVISASMSTSSATAQLFDTGGEWQSGTLGVNLSGQTERVLDPSQTRAFDSGLLGGWNLQPQQQMFASTNSNANDTVGADLLGVSGIPILSQLVNIIVKVFLEVIGVQIQMRDTLTDMASEIRSFRGDFTKFDASGRLTNDTSGLVDRSASSDDLVLNERMRILKQILVGLVKFVVEKVIMPMIQALFQGLISSATTAIGGAVGSAIAPGVGTAAGAAIGGVVGQIAGAGLSGLASIATSILSTAVVSIADALIGGAFGLFDDGGLATGTGLMPKATIKPERVLSPGTTQSFDRLVDALTSGKINLGGGRSVTIHAPFNVSGGASGGEDARDRLLELMS